MTDYVRPCSNLLHSLPIHSSSWSISSRARITTQSYLGAGSMLIHPALTASFPASLSTFVSLYTLFCPQAHLTHPSVNFHSFPCPFLLSPTQPAPEHITTWHVPLWEASTVPGFPVELRHTAVPGSGAQGAALGQSRNVLPCLHSGGEGQRPLLVPQTPPEGGDPRWDPPHLSSRELLCLSCGAWGAGTLAVTLLQPTLSPRPGDSRRTGVPFPSGQASAPSPARLSSPDTTRLLMATLTATERTPE